MSQSNSRWSVYRRTMRYYAPYRNTILTAFLLVLITTGIQLLQPWPLKYIIDSVLDQKRTIPFLGTAYHDVSILLLLCGLMVGIQLFSGLLGMVNSYLQVEIGLKALARIRYDLFAHLQRLSLKFHDARSSADSMYRVSYDAQAIQSLFNRGISTIFRTAVTLISMIIIMMIMDWQLTLLALGIAPILLLAIYFFADRIRRESTTISEAESALSSRVQEGLSGIRIIHSFAREEYEQSRFEEYSRKSLKANLQLNFTQVKSALVIGTLMGTGTAVMTYLGARHVMDGTLSVGDLLVFIAYLAMLYEPLQTLSYTSWALEGAAAGAQRVFEILDVPDEIQDRKNARTIPTTRGNIEFDRVAFGYDDHKMILKDISLKIEPGQSVAFVGATGTGKTTLLSLIPRFYDPNMGVVRLDGTDLRDIQKKSLRQNIGMVLQDTMLLAGNIADNIGYGRLGASPAEIEAAAKAAKVHDFVLHTAMGYKTEVGERGIRLSVGQRQRIGIARAFLKNAPILLLDEPTSALDPETESTIMETLRDLMKGRTTIIVTHRIATVHASDKIFVLENGAVVEAGKGPELLSKGGVYARLYQAQMSSVKKG